MLLLLLLLRRRGCSERLGQHAVECARLVRACLGEVTGDPLDQLIRAVVRRLVEIRALGVVATILASRTSGVVGRQTLALVRVLRAASAMNCWNS